ncbi:unnamed protein product [Psylliodes chrysocephalus]|uniref:Regulatory protein zeste n=1 Tax=Psylliodes chrysocephalus TaxID=3402493 RepID=A0A9P0GJK4_9CUCU|nr:unnamed protein product [Psylliodes chrysocephala]
MSNKNVISFHPYNEASTSKGKRIRGTNFSKEEELALLSIISRHKNIIENKTTSSVLPSQKEEAWRKIADAFNSCNPMRSIAQMKSKYDNLKTAARRFSGNANRNLYGTGGGPPVVVNPNPVYDEVLSIINKKTVSGLVNEYDDDYLDQGQSNIEIIEETSEDLENEVGIENERTEIYQDQIVDEDETHETEESQNNTWKFYTPKNIQQKKHPKLSVLNKSAPKKVRCLVNEDRRKEKRHEKEMELLDLEIEEKKKSLNSN